jgi:hypothetical protein
MPHGTVVQTDLSARCEVPALSRFDSDDGVPPPRSTGTWKQDDRHEPKNIIAAPLLDPHITESAWFGALRAHPECFLRQHPNPRDLEAPSPMVIVYFCDDSKLFIRVGQLSHHRTEVLLAYLNRMVETDTL